MTLETYSNHIQTTEDVTVGWGGEAILKALPLGYRWHPNAGLVSTQDLGKFN